MERIEQNWPVSSSLKELLSSLKPHDHLCLIYESYEEWVGSIVPFILSGIERGEKCIYVIDTSTAQQVKTFFQQAGLDVAEAENRGQLDIVHERDTYTRHGFFDPDLMIELLISETEGALKQGYPALRVAGEMSWALRGHAGSEKLLEYEAKLNRDFFPHYPCVAICQYNRWKFDPETIKGVMLTHPILIRKGQVYRNFYYIEPEDYLNHKKSEREVQHWLNNLERERRIQKDLRESEEKYHTLFNQAVAGIYIHDLQGQMIDVNKEACSQLGYTREELLDLAVFDFHPDKADTVNLPKEEILNQWNSWQPGERLTFEAEHQRKDGTVFPAQVSTGVVQYGNQKLILAIVTDITERKQAEQALIESQQTLDALMEHIPIGITIADAPDYCLRRVSRHGLELMGWPREKHEGLTVEEILNQWEVYKPDGVIKAALEELPLVKAISKGEIVFGQELVQIHQDGRAIPIICDAGPIKNEDGQITGGIVAWQDMTERKKSEKALRESEQRARRQREAVADLFLEETITAGEVVPAVQKITEVLSRSVKTERVSIWVIDENCEQLQCLDLYESSTGKHSAGDILYMKTFPSYFESILQDSRISVANAQEDPKSRELYEGYLKPLGIASLLDAGIVVEGKLKGVVSFEHVGEQRIWHIDEEAFASTVASMVGQLFVEAERKKANEEIRILNEELEQRVKDRTAELEAVNEELASFVYSVSHDFRAPLRAIDGFSAKLNEKYNDQLDEKARHYLSRIRNAVLRMSDLIDDLLKLSRINRAEFNPQKVDLSRLAEERVQLLQETEPERRVQVKIAPGLTAWGDQGLLQAALENLIENAWKFSANETQAIIEVGRTTIDGTEVFFVRDNGVGFNMAYADKLFGAFQRLHGADEFPGTGIGLATVQRIINRHGGRVWAESKVGKGTSFYFTLPVFSSPD